MTALVLVLLIGGVVLFVQGFPTKLLLYFAVLPFQTWLQIHVGSNLWTLAVSGLLVLAAVSSLSVRPPDGDRSRAAYGLTAVVLLYGGLAVAQAFNPDLPSVTLGIRGARLFVEPILLYFVGAEVARRPSLARKLLVVVLVTGAVVIAYGIKQGLFGFDGREFSHYRRNFAPGATERRVFSTMAGATVLGHYVTFVILLAGGVLFSLRRALRGWPLFLLIAGAGYVIILTGQRGVLISAAAAAAASGAVAISRLQWRSAALYSAAVLTLLIGVVMALVVVTPVEDRRAARIQANSAFEAARVKLALLKTGGEETSLQLRLDHLHNAGQALTVAPLGVGTGLSLVIDPGRSQRTTLLGTSGFNERYRPRVPAISGESYYYTVSTELGLLGISLFLAIGLFAIVTAAGVAVRDPDPAHAVAAMAATGFFVMVLMDSFTVDAMASQQVSSYFWLLLGMVGRWAHNLPPRRVVEQRPPLSAASPAPSFS